METNGDNFAVTLIAMANMAYKFLTYTDEEIKATYNWEMYIFLLCIFVSFTNQVSIDFDFLKIVFKMNG